ncbi:ABC transporter permease [Ktedonobacter robiniae]|uniref:ABC transporter n=1 Tax=Ktedonobacter robiniae TaxID=2778365 RepID=A0ABQ3UV23_9CHLR|nr:ABC transporter permease subunit [Ktedonobacter robiniae]GHO56699.1 ABC transporter [Ktedonobacter robiniae]
MDVPVIPGTDTTQATLSRSVKRRSGIRWGYSMVSWLGLAPFLVFCLLFEILPTLIILQSSFTDDQGAATLDNYQRILTQPSTLRAFQTSILLSLVSALISVVIGFIAAYGVYTMRTSWLRNLLIGFSSLAANFSGVPLAFAFVSTLGVTGFVTALFKTWFHINLYDLGFNLYNFWGLALTYVYFELPLMLLITVPALSALRNVWREAATNLGASTFTYWRKVAFPILLPSLIAALMLLFANAFGAFATAYALAQGNINLVTILISFAVAGNVSVDVGLGNALAVGMILVLVISVSLYVFMLRRASNWQGR